MGYVELIEKLQTLPHEKQAEVFDFVEFLAARFGETPAGADWTDASFSERAFGQALRDMEDEPVIHTIDDITEKW
jgi:hypothetical protein